MNSNKQVRHVLPPKRHASLNVLLLPLLFSPLSCQLWKEDCLIVIPGHNLEIFLWMGVPLTICYFSANQSAPTGYLFLHIIHDGQNFQNFVLQLPFLNR